jgi:ATP-dependent RNA helicase DeaD
MIAAFFGASSGDVDEIAAAARRGTKPAPIEADDEPNEDDGVTLYVSIGKRDGMKAQELSDWLVEHAKLARDEILKIRTREKHSFVKVPAERADEIVEQLSAMTFDDREVTVERAKAAV